MAQYVLVLYPQDADYQISRMTDVMHDLHKIGLIDASIVHHTDAWQVGSRFMELVTFLGCSPSLKLTEEKPGDPFTYVEIPAAYKETRLIAGQNARAPKCPHCKAPYEGWRIWKEKPFEIQHCDACTNEIDAKSMNWRQVSCVARQVIIIHEVFEGEAVPGDELMQSLHNITGTPWNYCYIAIPDEAKSLQ